DIFGDAIIRFEALHDLIEHGKLSNMAYSFVGPLASVPFYFLGKLYLKPEWWCARFNLFVFAAGLLIALRLPYDEAERRLLQKFALLLITASMFSNHLRGYGGEVFTTCLVAIGILAVRTGHVLAGWTAVIIGV